jgi:hypothetical protein
MEHVVFYAGPDGAPAFRRFAGQDEAVRFVEHLRNVEAVTDVSLHVLTPVPVSFRAYYKAEIPSFDPVSAVEPVTALDVAGVEPAPVAEAAPVAEPAPAVAAVPAPAVPEQLPEPVAPALAPAADVPAPAPAVAEAASKGRRSLGFFG